MDSQRGSITPGLYRNCLLDPWNGHEPDATTTAPLNIQTLAPCLKNSLKNISVHDPAKLKTVLDGHSINETNTDGVLALNFLNDIGFAQLAKTTEQEWAKAGARLGMKSSLTHFNLLNP